MKQIISSIRKKVIPTKQKDKEKSDIAKLALELVKKEVSKYSDVVSVELGGSFAKGTWLSDKADIDIFIKFKVSVSEKKFVEKSKRIGFASMKKYHPYVRYSEHPYVEAKIKNTKVNVVPCYSVNLGNWKSSADRSPFHTHHMKNSLSDDMKNEVRILKAFLRAQGIYGAEIAKQGFSGYVAEVLILNFGNFENVAKTFAKIKENEVIGDTHNTFDTLISIIDPIDNNRNLAAAISNENIGKFILLCRSFINKPTLSFFKRTITSSSKNWNNVLILKFSFSKRSPDIIWGQVKKASSSIATQLNIGGFKVIRFSAFTDEKKYAYLFFMLESFDISKVVLKEGPDFFNEHDTRQFIEKNKRKCDLMWINNNGKVQCLVKRKTNNAKRFLTELLKTANSGIPSGLQADFKKGYRVFVGDKNLSKSIKEEVSDLVSTNENIFYST